MPTPDLVFYGILGAIALFAVLMVAEDVIKLIAKGVARFAGVMPKGQPLYGSPRSGKWPAFRKHILALTTSCEACGLEDPEAELEVHHVLPFHLHPDKELDPRNVVVLCTKHNCHFAFGHNYDWHAYNPHVRDDIAVQRLRVEKRAYE